MNKSINASNSTKTPIFSIKHSGLGYSFFGFNPYCVSNLDLNANNRVANGENPTHSLKTRVNK